MAQVLIARPNDFVVEHTATAVRRLGFEPLRATTVDDLTAQLKMDLAGVVVSTAVSSVTALSIGDALPLVRRTNPTVPIVITSLSSVETARTTLRQELAGWQDWPVLDAATLVPDERLGQPGVLLCVTRAVLMDGTGDAALRRHLLRTGAITSGS